MRLSDKDFQFVKDDIKWVKYSLVFVTIFRVHTKSSISNSRTFKNIFWGKTNLFKNISGTSSAHFIYNTINRAISSRERKSLTEVGAVKNVN